MPELGDVDSNAIEVEFRDEGEDGEETQGEDGAQDEDRATARKRGVKRGTKRGPYQRVAPDARRRIVECFQADGDWKVAATANGVAVQTAYGWITRPDGDGPSQRGGAINRKVKPEHADKLLSYVEANPLITLKEMAAKLRAET